MCEDVCLVDHQLGSLSFILIFGTFLFQMKELHSKCCEYTLKILEGLIEAKDEEALNIGGSLEEGSEGKSQYYVLGMFSCTPVHVFIQTPGVHT